MNVFELTRALVDIESITNNEERVGVYLYDYSRAAGRALRRPARAHRSGAAPLQRLRAVGRARSTVTLSTHMDTVPPFFASREDDEHIWGRGACDTKGIIAAMIKAVEALLEAGDAQFRPAVRGGRGAQQRRRLPGGPTPRGSRYIINGEPTENKLALGSKGALRYEVAATGKMAHSAYPELGDSAIHKLIDALADMRAHPAARRPAARAEHAQHRHASPAAARPT